MCVTHAMEANHEYYFLANQSQLLTVNNIDFFCSCYAVANYILEANIEARSGWPLPKPALSDSFLEFMSIPRRPSTSVKIVL